MISSIGLLGLGGAGARVAEAATAAGLRVATTDLRDVDVLVEAVEGSPAVRAARLAEHAGSGRLLVTTSVTQPVSALAPPGARDRTVGLRFGWTGTAVEVALPAETADWARAATYDLVDRLDLRPTPGQDRPVGFELLFGLLNDAAALHGAGYVSATDLDAAMRLGCGLPLGPLRLLDEIGLDTAVALLTELHERTGDPRSRPAAVLADLVAAGRLGRASGRGFHDYPLFESTPTPDPAAGPRLVGVVGTGTMANGIAQALVSAGVAVVQVGRSSERVIDARDALDWHIERTGLRRPGRWAGGTELSLLAECELVVEAVVEDLAVKRALFAELDRVCPPGAVLATTTSGLPVAECAAATRRPESVLGLHFFNPAATMPLVELVRARQTGDAALAVARQVCARLGKHAVECGDRAGFVVNALLFPYLNDALRLTAPEHVDDLDAGMRAVHGFPMGPARLLDLVGTDVALRVLEHLGATPAPLLVRAVAEGHLGRKTRRGIRELCRALTPVTERTSA